MRAGAVTALRFSRDGALLASGSADTTLVVWDVVAEAGLCRFKGHKDAVTDLVSSTAWHSMDCTGGGWKGGPPERGWPGAHDSAKMLVWVWGCSGVYLLGALAPVAPAAAATAAVVGAAAGVDNELYMNEGGECGVVV